MWLFDALFGKKKIENRKDVSAFLDRSAGLSNPLFTISFDGEKNLGEIGPIKDYVMNHEALRARSWQAYVESEIAQTIIKRFSSWILGTGLKLNCEPVDDVLASEKIKIDPEAFNAQVESRFKLFCKSKNTDYSSMRSLNKLARKAHIDSIVGGDCLVIIRYVKKKITVQIVDGAHVCSPAPSYSPLQTDQSTGYRIRHGIVLDDTGMHVAYYVKREDPKNPLGYVYDRIEARSKSGLVMAYMVYGLEYRIDTVRGVPLLGVVLETLKKMERYKEATLGSAEERQKIVMQIVHDQYSTEESPFSKNMAKAYDADAKDDLPKDVAGKELANTVAATTNKQVFNMPRGSKMESLNSKNELYFKDFYTVNAGAVCASVEIPPEVAFSKYDSNFSASRAALKDWEQVINKNRHDFSEQFYQNVYNFWLEVQILLNKVDAPGYLAARGEDNDEVVEAYRNCRFTGVPVPHIDPLKEVMAERAKLGTAADAIPLTTVEDATRNLNGGDSDSNMTQFADEYQTAKKLKIPVEMSLKPATPPATGA
jgi:capsid protein